MFAVLKLQGNIYTIFNTALYKLPGIGGTCVGLRLGWLNIIIPATVGIIFYIMLLAVTFLCSEHSFSLKNTDIVFFILTFFTGTILIFTSEYVGWTALRAEIIEGVQGRYFIPILPCLMLPFAYKNHFVKTFFKNKNFGRIKLAYLIIIAFTLNFIALVRVYKFYPDISKTEKVTASLSSDKSSITLTFERMEKYDELKIAVWSEAYGKDDLHWFSITGQKTTVFENDEDIE